MSLTEIGKGSRRVLPGDINGSVCNIEVAGVKILTIEEDRLHSGKSWW